MHNYLHLMMGSISLALQHPDDPLIIGESLRNIMEICEILQEAHHVK